MRDNGLFGSSSCSSLWDGEEMALVVLAETVRQKETSLRTNSQLYILHKDATPYIETGQVVSVS